MLCENTGISNALFNTPDDLAQVAVWGVYGTNYVIAQWVHYIATHSLRRGIHTGASVSISGESSIAPTHEGTECICTGGIRTAVGSSAFTLVCI